MNDAGPLVALGVAIALTPLVALLSRRIGFVARPREDRLHDKPTPYLGGLAVLSAYIAGLFASGLILTTVAGRPATLLNVPPATLLLYLAVAAFLLGLLDDWRNLSPPAKMAGQVVIAASFLSAGGGGPFVRPALDGIIGLFWVVGLMNACNFLDNMDGALGGAALPAAGGLAILAGGPELRSVALVLSGAIGGFLLWNRPPASIFLGDAGSLFLGAALATTGWMIASAAGTTATALDPTATLMDPTATLMDPTATLMDPTATWLALPLIMSWPIFDMTFVTVTRLSRRQSPLVGGLDHTTHRLATWLGCRRRAFLVVLLASGLTATAGCLLARRPAGIAAAGLLLFLILFLCLGYRLNRVPIR
ncbi:MAG: MraY family glycosyltransferase [Candidatus Eisenbacteria bacterium]|nr:MraY family glycosyltransferase [Candidatus Eisenbacteria bacterium]